MQQHDCLELQRKARRSGRLRPNALLLLAEICDLHGCEKGCIAGNDTFAENLGATPRSVRNWLSELKDHGLIAEAQQGPNRLLIPRTPEWVEGKDDSTAENSFQEDGQSSGKDVPGRKEDSKEGGKDFPQQRDNNSEGTRERALAHEGSSEESPDELFSALVDVWRSVGTAPPLTKNTENVLWEWAQDGTVQDIGLFREVLQEQSADTTAKGCGLSTGILLKEYRKQRDSGKLEPWQKEDERYSVDEQGRVCYMGTPVSETGPQNVYDEPARKDGSTRPEPEVSPS